jgi:lantibiotic transport system permease protein
MTLTASLRSELLKLKRTSLFYLVPIGAFIIPLIMVFDYGTPSTVKVVDGWENFYMEGTRVMVFAFLPLFFVLTSTLMIQIEVRNNTWKQVLASPQSYSNILLSKFIMLQLMGLVFIAIYNIFMVAGAAFLDSIFENHFLSYLNHGQEIVKINFMAWSSTIGISALCFWMALRSKNFIAPIAIGFALWMAGPLAALEFKWPYADQYVYALQLTIMSKRFEHEQGFHQLLSLAYGVVFLGIAYVEFVWQRTTIFRWMPTIRK